MGESDTFMLSERGDGGHGRNHEMNLRVARENVGTKTWEGRKTVLWRREVEGFVVTFSAGE